MSWNKPDEADTKGTLVEPQGVNAGGPVDREPEDEETTESGEPPARPLTAGTLDDEMAGLPAQKPGYPGQQRSVDTS
ncbi:hypothetical protein [Actinomadura fibrosa]|uniref:Uncharacterized protein n=1 Tax=Actinomadura fibrosa TaxID=111802 RepID=A0ABW2XGP6_9ACTN|nr:hypothetical protein [Actinomadura fibrosa]